MANIKVVAQAEQYDVAVLTVIGPELQAVQAALKVDSRRNRLRIDGAIYWNTTRYSNIQDRDLRIVIGVVGSASQANAGLAAADMITRFDPAILVLVGIAAGWQGKVKIGDVAVSRDVADVSLNVAETDGIHPRPSITSLIYPVQQMMQSFTLDQVSFNAKAHKLFGKPIVAPVGQEEEYAQKVASAPRVHECTIASDDTLLRDATVFAKLATLHQGIRVAEMEAGGFVKACHRRNPARAWLVIRGISDFGNEFKNDDFHPLAASAAAAYLDCFLADGLDIENLRVTTTPTAAVAASTTVLVSSEAVEKGEAPRSAPLLSLGTTDFISGQSDQFAGSLSEASLRDFEAIQESWRTEGGRTVLGRLRALKDRPEWRVLKNDVRGKVLRFEAALVLALDKDTVTAKALAKAARECDRSGSFEVLDSQIAFHESGVPMALQQLGNPCTLGGWNIRLALLLDSGQWRLVLDEYQRPPAGLKPDAESKRIHALSLAWAGDVAAATREIEEVLAVHPKWLSLRIAAGIISYFSSISPALFAKHPKHWPAPTDPNFVKRDRDTIGQLRKAEAIFTELLVNEALDESTRHALEGWRLASLANNAERQTEAKQYCAELLERTPTHPFAVYWAVQRNYVADLSASATALIAELSSTS